MEIKNLSCYLAKKEIIRDISFELKPGRIYVLLGKNGCGKTTLLRTLTGLLKPTSGSITLDEQDLLNMKDSEKAKVISYLPQSLPSVAISLYHLLQLARYPFNSDGRRFTSTDADKIEEALATTSMKDKERRLVCHLSGGEKTMAYLAMALAKDCDYLFLDEPFASLDLLSQKHLIEILKKEKEKGKCIFVSVHDLLLASKLADDVILLNDGKIAFNGEKNEFIMSHCYQDIYHVEFIQTKDDDGNSYSILKEIESEI